jgi:predicted GNAT family acetyltransferase
MTEIVRNAPALHRFEIYEGDEIAGFAEYVDHEQQRIFHHTEIAEKFGGKGLASQLIKTALTETTNAGLRIVPVCPFVAKFIDKHDDFGSEVDEVTPAVLAQLENS